MIILWQKKALLHKFFFSLKRGSFIYRVFNYLKHHVYYVSIKSFIYYVSKNNFLEQHVYNNIISPSVLDSGLSYFWHVMENLEVS